jgi:hypothetical protein
MVAYRRHQALLRQNSRDIQYQTISIALTRLCPSPVLNHFPVNPVAVIAIHLVQAASD